MNPKKQLKQYQVVSCKLPCIGRTRTGNRTQLNINDTFKIKKVIRDTVILERRRYGNNKITVTTDQLKNNFVKVGWVV